MSEKKQVKSPSIVLRPFIRPGGGWGCDKKLFQKSSCTMYSIARKQHLVAILDSSR